MMLKDQRSFPLKFEHLTSSELVSDAKNSRLRAHNSKLKVQSSGFKNYGQNINGNIIIVVRKQHILQVKRISFGQQYQESIMYMEIVI